MNFVRSGCCRPRQPPSVNTYVRIRNFDDIANIPETRVKSSMRSSDLDATAGKATRMLLPCSRRMVWIVALDAYRANYRAVARAVHSVRAMRSGLSRARLPVAHASQTHTLSRESGGTLSRTSAGIFVAKHQQVAPPSAIPQAFGAWQSGQRRGSSGALMALGES